MYNYGVVSIPLFEHYFMQCIVHTPTNKTADSEHFYQTLGFNKIPSGSQLLFTDGKVVIEVNSQRQARAGIKLYQPSWEKERDKLAAFTHLTKLDNGYLLADPSGVWIYLVEGEPDWQAVEVENSYSTLGNFMGVTLETTDLKRSDALYEALGFTRTFGTVEKGMVAFDHNGFGITVMKPLQCPHLFFNPSISYFNGPNNLAVIEKIRALHIPITEEITHFNKEGKVDNVIIRDPGGYGFFIFSD
jgi:hypothetical protein